jgi:predicted metalloendopeptidase
MHQFVGFQTKNPNEANPQELEEYYAKTLVTDNYFHNRVAFVQFDQNKLWNHFFKPTDRNKSVSYPYYASIEYLNALNKLSISPGSMQMPLFHVDIPEYVVYGAWGFSVATRSVPAAYLVHPPSFEHCATI